MDLHFRKSTVEDDPLSILNEVLSVLGEEDIDNICFLYLDKRNKSYLYAASCDLLLLSRLGQSGYIFINSFDPREYTIRENWTCVGNQELLN